ncbi:hypothetical protein [uncultured Polaribacter sp.]|uniref:hypothetical protein n=1 Tax=uncultured Polaribacter sp. TaxID=174711 RepID=UPI0026332DEA|nr:hypothetical protein [uncultured Polaribacter sp.]
MKNLLLYTILIFLIFASCSICPSENEFIGKYYSQKEGIENYIEIQKNGNFNHFYSKGELTLKHSGTWEKSKNGYCYLEFSEWKNFDEKGEKFEILGNQILYINGKYLDHTPDGETLSSFIKKEKGQLTIGKGNDVIVTLKIEEKNDIEKIEFSSNNSLISISQKELAENNVFIYKFSNKGEGTFKTCIYKLNDTICSEQYVEKGYEPKIKFEKDSLIVADFFGTEYE